MVALRRLCRECEEQSKKQAGVKITGGTEKETTVPIKVRFAYVYIAEAHTVDEWPMPFGNEQCRHSQPKTLEERMRHADEFRRSLVAAGAGAESSFPIFVDSLDDGFLNTFAPWPERFYVFAKETTAPHPGKEGGSSSYCYRLSYISQPDAEDGHRIVDLRKFLQWSPVLRDHIDYVFKHKHLARCRMTQEEAAQFGPVPVSTTTGNGPRLSPPTIFDIN